MQKLWKSFNGRKDVVFVGVCTDGNKAAENGAKFKEKHKLTFEIVREVLKSSDGKRAPSSLTAFGIKGVPFAAIIDKDGKVAYLKSAPAVPQLEKMIETLLKKKK